MGTSNATQITTGEEYGTRYVHEWPCPVCIAGHAWCARRGLDPAPRRAYSQRATQSGSCDWPRKTETHRVPTAHAHTAWCAQSV